MEIEQYSDLCLFWRAQFAFIGFSSFMVCLILSLLRQLLSVIGRSKLVFDDQADMVLARIYDGAGFAGWRRCTRVYYDRTCGYVSWRVDIVSQ